MAKGMLRLGAAVALVAAGFAAVVGAATSNAPATVTTPAQRLDPQARALLVSDSAWLGIKTYGAIDAVQGFEHMLDLASCRRRMSGSCTNYDGHVPITLLDEIEWRGGTFDTLIVATGYNDSDSTFVRDVDAVIEATRRHGYKRVVWVTLRSNVGYESPGDLGFGAVFERNNATLVELVASGDYPEIVIADWATYAHDQPDWFAGDGIHLRRDGPWAAADYISRKIAHLDGAPCPQPVAAGANVQSPCPDPDQTGPIVELTDIYPIGERNPTAGFFMEWQGHGAWPEPPWWLDETDA